ncbi:helix-turn-helix domain-containing protein [Pseudodesulfovibrio thermohalotolerans]|uniref:helix-turn-helix domain-containing protein n=1 Tax=Pseudodesulfovibrio thermohalotolerans TaxID=2880651 RepID=UPI002442886C|nr:helix-turn-helix domain-containing protein [Pseudodesulfovibrio thermohalotolerans]WFS63063.1 helix-turn-helix domain-containing protein [Pseudodesulfovibrio thermohalotolerans]
MDDLTKRLGGRIRKLRKSRGQTQEQLAQEAGVSDKYLSEVERGVSKVSVEVLDKVASGLNVELRDLLAMDLEEDRKQMEDYLVRLIKGASDEQLVMLQRVVRAILV